MSAVGGISIRRAVSPDGIAVAKLWLRSFDAALPTVRRAHTDAEVTAYFSDIVVPQLDTWVACRGPEVVGMATIREGDLDQLYVDPAHQGQGIGAALLDQAKVCRPTGLELWVFQVNERARRFYERHGFVELFRTDGQANEEREPDIRMAWRPGPG